MFPIIQAQELSHPQLAEQNQFATKIEDALLIPNEEIQFQSLRLLMTLDKSTESQAVAHLVLSFLISGI